ncbi:dTDP-4-dehydrorhamnose reductase [Halomonas sp. DP8Y7-1]|uniref:dTDP-4-dehydrorhamnose reductase n=1 Tax=unclassified Halomonas TaxID=2609666 RepID=UPI001C9731E4|nr:MULTISPECIES: dTDP-4-dehydrorhamnose reductase [unclassified Halomonas]MBY5928661.1 dTDP-4-dehydrorhamnose reductase [Halomonas sp. DP8Y7-3]MBY6028791.1 dTDP-4-dehydrorhamnose reductase [Halomonas sp. DP8Y7-1]
MSVVLLGASGQVGHELRKALAIHADVQAPSRPELDLADIDQVRAYLSHYHPQWVINAAAYTAVDKAESETELAFRLNAGLPACLAKYCAERDILLTHYSSDYVYPGDGEHSWKEDSPTGPLSYYGQSKLAGDKAVQASGCASQIFRTSWVYSARGNNFMKTMLRLGRERKSLSVVDDQVGSPTPARLIADMTVWAWQRYLDDQELTGMFHLAPRGEVSWYGFAREIFRLAREANIPLAIDEAALVPLATSEYPTAATRPSNSRLCLRRTESTFGVRLPHWKEQLALTLTDYLK